MSAASPVLTRAAARPVARPASRPAARPTGGRPVYRLTRRGRVVVLLLGLMAVLAVGVVWAGGSVASEEPEATVTHVVAPGDTLWDIADALSEDGGIRAMMQHLQELNDLDSVGLVVGQRLEVPAP